MEVYIGGSEIKPEQPEQLAGISLLSQQIIRIFWTIELPKGAWQHIAVVSDHGQHEVRVLAGPVGEVNPSTAVHSVTLLLDRDGSDPELRASIVAQLLAFWQTQAEKAIARRAECYRILASLQPGKEYAYLNFKGSKQSVAQEAADQLAQAFPALAFEVRANNSSTFISVSGSSVEINKFRALFKALNLV